MNSFKFEVREPIGNYDKKLEFLRSQEFILDYNKDGFYMDLKPTGQAGSACCKVNCYIGDEFKIKATSLSNSAIYYICDYDGKVIYANDRENIDYDSVIKIEDDGYLLINADSTQEYSAVKVIDNGKGWVDYSKYLVAPPKFAQLLDEQLDEATISLKKIRKDIFNPNTICRLTIINTPESIYYSDYDVRQRAESEVNISYDVDTKKITEELTQLYVIANDSSVETTSGSGTYDHDIYLIELTKIMEGYIGDSITFTNVLGNFRKSENIKDYAKCNYVEETKADTGIGGVFEDTISGDFGSWIVKGKFTATNGQIDIPTLEYIRENERLPNGVSFPSTNDAIYDIKSSIKLKDLSTGLETDINSTSIDVKSGNYQLIYKYLAENIQLDYRHALTLTYTIVVLENRYPLKKITMLDVVNRVCDLIEPLRYGEKPNFRLKGVIYDDKTGNAIDFKKGGIAEKLDGILAPEYAFSNMNLREMLKQVGGRIHAEPRIKDIKFDEDDKPWFEVDYDFFGSKEKSKISNRQYITVTHKSDINEYCTSLDSTSDNLINQLNWAQGVVVEPFSGGGKTLRSESSAVRLAENDGTCISTELPIYQIGDRKQVVCTYIPGVSEYDSKITLVEDNKAYFNILHNIAPSRVKTSGGTFYYTRYDKEKASYYFEFYDGALGTSVGDVVKVYLDKEWDIAPYIFEKAQYDNLSSYGGTYPYSKAYALYYTQGQKNIKGLFFKPENVISPVFENYTIINILSSVTGINLKNVVIGQYLMELAFRVQYLPIFGTRLKTYKRVIGDGVPRALAYNQSANLVDASFYGENLKGVVARLGNVQKSYTYNLAFLSDIPKIGTKFDDNHYISNIAVEVLPSIIKCTIGLSKNFNRISENIMINTNKRMWEVSEKQAFARKSVIQDYVLISQKKQKEDAKSLIYGKNLAHILFNEGNPTNKQITNAEIQRYSLNEAYIEPQSINLPVVSSSMGDSMLFGFGFEDNYSAGQKATLVTGSYNTTSNPTGYWGDYVPYNDYYGKFYWLYFNLYRDNAFIDNNNAATPESLPQGFLENAKNNSLLNNHNLKYRKDSREIPYITYEISVVTDDESLIIGSALTRNCSLVNAEPQEYALYGFMEDINNISSEIDLSNATEIYNALNLEENSIEIDIDKLKGYKSWAICTKPNQYAINVEDEFGKEIEQYIERGQELVLGQNKIPESGVFHFMAKKDIYKI